MPWVSAAFARPHKRKVKEGLLRVEAIAREEPGLDVPDSTIEFHRLASYLTHPRVASRS
jgi:hypothetical protein